MSASGLCPLMLIVTAVSLSPWCKSAPFLDLVCGAPVVWPFICTGHVPDTVGHSVWFQRVIRYTALEAKLAAVPSHRIPCMSVTDVRVWAAAEEGKPGASQPDLPADAGSHTIERLDQLRNSQGGLGVAEIRSQLQKTMQADAAVFRTQVMD